MNKKNKRIWIIGGLVLGVILLAVFAKKGENATLVATEIAVKRNITEIVSVNGKIQPESEVKISPDVSGEIIEMAVKEGDSVVAGQLLLRINPDIYQTQMNQLQANLDNGLAGLSSQEAQKESVKAALIQAESNYLRIKKLYEQKVSSEQEYEQARLQFETAKANMGAADKNILAAKYSVQSLRASLDQGRKNMGRTSIFAPASGIVTNLNSEKGERVVGTAQMAGTEIMRVSNLNSMEVEVNVNENDIVRIKNGDSANIKVSAWPNRIFKGIVTEIANSARFEAASAITDQATNYVVKVRILASSYSDLGEGRKQPFRSGMTATVDIQTATKNNVLCIPISAVTTREPTQKSDSKVAVKDKKEIEKNKGEITRTWVFILENGKAKSIEVTTGIQDINYFELLTGLKEGDEVISAPGMAIAKRLNDGDKVKKVDKDKVFEK
ncbi:MAG: efflux RND transporter periplasmic adaptor subunit [Bacteroidetes bacterium]|nr:efflux RND transporter periplasmic adaptor subunit [Bacteroidota bacterium]